MKASAQPQIKAPAAFDFEGHRGCRGLMPENTIPAFLKAMELGVTTLEMDIVVSADGQLVVSHDPWFSAEFCTAPGGKLITEADEKNHLIYKMTYAEVRQYDCGLKPHPRFPAQQKQPAVKPLLREVVQAADSFARLKHLPLPHFNIETKCEPDWDNLYAPTPEVFTLLLLTEMRRLGIIGRSTLQSFDQRSLKLAPKLAPKLKLVLLVENTGGLDSNLKALGFTPSIYSPDFHLVDAALVKSCHALGIKIVPWTVNEPADMQRMIELGVDGLISDYPDRYRQFQGG